MQEKTLNHPFPTPYESVIYKSRYARWLEDGNRRENWDETVYRLVDYYNKRIGESLTQDEAPLVLDSIYNLEVMPSMGALMTAGPALDRCNVARVDLLFFLKLFARDLE